MTRLCVLARGLQPVSYTSIWESRGEVGAGLTRKCQGLVWLRHK